MSYKDIIQNWKEKKISSIEDLENVLSNFNIIFAYNSGVIENPEITYHNTREVWENEQIINFTGNVRTIFEIQNQKKCYDFIKDFIIKQQPITPEFIKSIHKFLTDGTYDKRRYDRGERPGEYKKHDYVVGNDQGALPEEVPYEIEELCNELSSVSDSGDNILRAAAYLHCKFENTHPFADGNGRVGRTLMNYFLMIHNYPPLIVRNESKNIYYKALDVYDQSGDISHFVKYMKDELEVTWASPKKQNLKLDSYINDTKKESILHKKLPDSAKKAAIVNSQRNSIPNSNKLPEK